MDSVELRKNIKVEQTKIVKLKQEQERIDRELKVSMKQLAIYEKNLKLIERIEADALRKMEKAQEALAAELAAVIKPASERVADQEGTDAGSD